MGNINGEPSVAEENNYYKIRKNKEKQMKILYDEIKLLKSNNKLSNLEQLILTYEKLFEYDNTNENDVLQYLLLFKEKLKEGKIEKKDMKEKLDIYNIFISDDNYKQHFQEYKRVNSFTKINNLIKILKSDLTDDNYYLKRKAFIDKINDLKEKENTYNSSNVKFKQEILWKNKELYLYNIYMNYLETLILKIKYHKKSFSSLALNNKIYLDKQKEFIITKDKKLYEELQSLKIYEGEFMKIYIDNLQNFLNEVDTRYKLRFLNDPNNYLINEEDKNIFEDYIQFLSSYNFDGKDMPSIINLWKETFVSLTHDEMMQLIEIKNNNNFIDKLTFELQGNNLIIKQKGEIKKEIKDIDNYVFSNLIEDLINNYKSMDFDYYIYKNIKPNYYENKLFIIQNKNVWKQLVLNILSSKALRETQESLFDSSYIDILSDKIFLSEIIDNIKFFIYKTTFLSSLNENSHRIYEYGLYKNLNNKALALLIFYAFNNISNIHEISGHLNIAIQKRYSSNDKSFESSNIDKYDYNLFSQYAKEREKESGETMEILLFGRKIDELTIKEALFSLDPLNYVYGKNYFKDNFKKCNKMKFKDIVHESTKETYFKQLGIDIDKLPENINTSFTNKDIKNKITEETTFKKELLDHPIEFYFDNK